ncbi:MAG: pyridoxal 5'-phosphate synthase glutaminase subunit PdxT [Thermoflexales bacterium]|nr:pyridoxal 5'-phosphate synthase glutaminase subunit PdxT [Thermoflexales bacterium]
MRIGILALQGAFIEHEQVLRRLGVETSQVRLPSQMAGLDGLIIPGGESTTIGQLAVQYGLVEPIRELAASGRPVWGTCAGLIFLARQVEHCQPLLSLLDVRVVRNAFGRQVDSFEIDLDVPALYAEEDARPFHAIFIRAPLIESVGEGVSVLARLPAACLAGRSLLPDQAIVAARQANLLATAFHPELGGDERFHRYFLSMAI